MKLINKSALVAEIERRLNELYNLLPNASKVENGMITISESCNTGKYTALESFKDYIDSLEVKEVDLDCEEELKKYGISSPKTRDVCIASHFYELGLKAQKGE